jgi:hypothetical protein
MEDGARKMNVVAGYGGMGPVSAVGDDLAVICGDWWGFETIGGDLRVLESGRRERMCSWVVGR